MASKSDPTGGDVRYRGRACGSTHPAVHDCRRDHLRSPRRQLLEKTGVKSPYLEQLGNWGIAKRDPRGWSATHAYFALISGQDVELAKGANAADVAWFKVDDLLPRLRLAFGHTQILQAVDRQRSKV